MPEALSTRQVREFGVAPGDENADVTRRQWLGRFIDMQRAGLLKGGMIGQMPQEQLGEPLPGTAPPPGPASRRDSTSSSPTRPHHQTVRRRTSRRARRCLLRRRADAARGAGAR